MLRFSLADCDEVVGSVLLSEGYFPLFNETLVGRGCKNRTKKSLCQPRFVLFKGACVSS